jgi:hypothetical protein
MNVAFMDLAANGPLFAMAAWFSLDSGQRRSGHVNRGRDDPMKKIITAAALSVALTVPAFAQSAAPATTAPAQTPAATTQPAPATTPAAPKIEASKLGGPGAATAAQPSGSAVTQASQPTGKVEAGKTVTPVAAPKVDDKKVDPKAATGKTDTKVEAKPDGKTQPQAKAPEAGKTDTKKQ